MREATVKGTRIRWRVAGDGPPLVFVHGLSGSSAWWRDVLPTLADGYECHVLDVPRFGAALHPSEMAEWLARWMDVAGLERTRLVAHSMSGAPAARLAAVRPDLVNALVLVSAVGMPSGRRVLGYALPLLAALRATSPAFVARLTGDALRHGPAGLLRGAHYAARADVREQVRSMNVPTLLLWGDRDGLVPLSLGEEWQRSIPCACLVVLRGVGHMPMVEQPRAFVAVLREFLDEPRDFVRRRPVRSVWGVGENGELTVGK